MIKNTIFRQSIATLLFIFALFCFASAQSASSFSKQGDKLLEQEKYAEAIDAYKKAVALKPDAVDFFNIGVAYENLKQYEDALNYYNKAAQIKPKDVETWHRIGETHWKLKQYDKAIDAYRQAVKLNPKSADARQLLSNAENQLTKSGANNQSNDSTVATQMSPRGAPTAADTNAFFVKAVELSEKGDFAGAEKAVRQSIKANPRFGEAYLVLGATLAELERYLERYEEAVEAVSKSLELLPKDSEDYDDAEGLLKGLKAELAKSGNASQTNKAETIEREKSSGNVSTPPLGKYVCNNIRAKMGGGYSFTLMGFLMIEPKSEYLWFEKRGKFSVSESGKIEWLTGTFSESEVDTEFEIKEDTSVISAKFQTGQGNYLLYTCSMSLKK